MTTDRAFTVTDTGTWPKSMASVGQAFSHLPQ